MYRCQTALSTISDPVQLEVHMGELKGKRGLNYLEEASMVWINSGRVTRGASDGGRTLVLAISPQSIKLLQCVQDGI